MIRSRLLVASAVMVATLAITIAAALLAGGGVSAAPGDVTADNVFGQFGSLTSGACNNGGVSANSLCGAIGIAIDPLGNVYIADQKNHRVLEYDDPLNTDFVADRVFGQGPSGTSFNTNTCPWGSPTASTLCNPGDVAVDSAGNLYVSDFNNERVLEYDNPIANDVIADRVFGQLGSFTTAIQNKGGIGANSLASPVAVAVDPAGNLYVSDRTNNRVLGYLSPLTDSTADIVFGQLGSFTTTAWNIGNVVSANGLNVLHGLGTDSAGNLYVADQGNHRVLKYNTPFSSGTTADLVFGQLGSFSSGVPDINGVTADSLESPSDVAADSAGNVYVSETGNERMLEYDSPATLGTAADLVFGQGPTGTNFSSFGSNVTASGYGDPYGFAIDPDCNLYVVDIGASRALEYDLPPKACVVAGTPTPTSTTCPVPACTATPTLTPTDTPSPTPTTDPCGGPVMCSPTPTPSCIPPPPCDTETPTPTPTETPTPLAGPTETPTPSVTPTETPFVDPTETPSPTVVSSPTYTATPPVVSTPPTGVWVAIDCNLTVGGLQMICDHPAGTDVDVGVVFGTNESELTLGAFRFTVHDTDASRLIALPPEELDSDANPDFNEELPGDDWLCLPPAQHAVVSDDAPGESASRIDCFQDHHSRIESGSLPPDSMTIMAIIHYTIPIDAAQGGVFLGVTRGQARDEALAEIASCGPTLESAMPCLPAVINITGPSCPAPDADCDGFNDSTPALHEGPANTNAAVDNCIGTYNPSQANADGNFVDLTPPKANDDLTWVNSDALGDACDDDDDNDGLLDSDEPTGCNGSGTLSAVLRDHDFDRFLDSVECALDTNPGAAASKPTLAACGASGDADGDGVATRVEYCYYGSSNSSTNTDGDTCTDGRELASVDTNTTVGAQDLGLVASAFGGYAAPPTMGTAWKMNMDIDKNGTVNAADLGLVAAQFGACP